MRNPWLKKNPFLSMWLSGANSVMGSARGHATAEARRQTSTLMAESARQAMRFWTGGLSGSTGVSTTGTSTKKRKRSR